VLFATLLVGCAPVPRPLILAQVDQVRVGAAAKQAHTFAEGAFAHAEELRRQANEAFEAGDTAGSALLGERALAAYAHAHVLARIARAEAEAREAEAKIESHRKELATLEEENLRIIAEADALEQKIRVERDAQPIQPSEHADAERERARLAAARSLALEARLLCSAARLLTGDKNAKPDPKITSELDEAQKALDKLDAELGPKATAAPIDEATRVRAACLAALSSVRRAAAPVDKAPGAGDTLLSELSAMGKLSPSRDDRGVVVTLREIFKGNELHAEGKARVAELGRVAAAHPAFPIEIVVHHDRPVSARDEASLRARGEAVKSALSAAASGARVETIIAGNAAPVVDPSGSLRGRNARIEIVFVTPEAF